MSRKQVKFNVNPLLSGPSLESRARAGSPFRLIPLSEIDIDPDQPRRVFDDEALTSLSESIKEHGVLSPVLVRVAEGGVYRLVSGERRFRATKMAGLNAIPAVIDEDSSEETTLAKQLVENIQREDLTPMERALAIGQLRERFELSVRDIARVLGISKSAVQRSLDILALPDDLQAALISGASESKILVLNQLSDREMRKELVSQLEHYTRTQLEDRVNELEAGEGTKVSHRGTAGRSKAPVELSIEDQRVLSEIQKALGTKVSIARAPKNRKRGKLTLEFYSDEDFGEIFRRLTKPTTI